MSSTIPPSKKTIIDKYLPQGEQRVYARAPGRVNLIGEHTDYNKGLVLPGAIDKYMYFGAVKNNKLAISATAIDRDEHIDIDLNNLKMTPYLWANFLVGILLECRKMGIQLSGFDCAFTSEVPIGAGMSSSSALECAFLVGVNELYSMDVDNWSLINMSQSSNHNFLGIKGGILDQFAALFGKEDQILLLDCDTLMYTPATIPSSKYSWLLINSCVKHNHLTSGYNTRVEECLQAVRDIQVVYPGVNHLSHVVDETDLDKIRFSSSTVEKRARYIIQENDRVRKFVQALQDNNLNECGRLLYASHQGLSQQYEVSCVELDFLVNEIRKEDRALGARMMGGGFGGCTINLVETEAIPDIKKNIKHAYMQEYGRMPEFYNVKISEGAGILDASMV